MEHEKNSKKRVVMYKYSGICIYFVQINYIIIRIYENTISKSI